MGYQPSPGSGVPSLKRPHPPQGGSGVEKLKYNDLYQMTEEFLNGIMVNYHIEADYETAKEIIEKIIADNKGKRRINFNVKLDTDDKRLKDLKEKIACYQAELNFLKSQQALNFLNNHNSIMRGDKNAI